MFPKDFNRVKRDWKVHRWIIRDKSSLRDRLWLFLKNFWNEEASAIKIPSITERNHLFGHPHNWHLRIKLLITTDARESRVIAITGSINKRVDWRWTRTVISVAMVITTFDNSLEFWTSTIVERMNGELETLLNSNSTWLRRDPAAFQHEIPERFVTASMTPF